MEQTDFTKIRDLLSPGQNILLTTHTHPDGDAIGSSLAFFWYLTRRGHQVSMLVPDPFPSFLAWLPGSEKILVFSRQQQECLQAIEQASLIFSLDYNDLSRLKDASLPVMQSQATKIVLDHHLFPAGHFDFGISVAGTSSTAELIFGFIQAMGEEHLVDRTIAEALYTGIVTDTGSFSYSCNLVNTYEVTAALFRYGIDGERIHRLIYDTYSEHRLRLLGYSLSEKLVVLPGYHTAYITLSALELQRFQYQIGDTEGLVNYALSMEGINLAALFTEQDDSIRISFRSKGNFSVEELARQHFDGGGHSNASGATSTLSMEVVVQKFRELLLGYSEALREVL